MSENAGVDPRVAAAEDAALDGEVEEPDATQAAEDPTGPREEPEPETFR